MGVPAVVHLAPGAKDGVEGGTKHDHAACHAPCAAARPAPAALRRADPCQARRAGDAPQHPHLQVELEHRVHATDVASEHHILHADGERSACGR